MKFKLLGRNNHLPKKKGTWSFTNGINYPHLPIPRQINVDLGPMIGRGYDQIIAECVQFACEAVRNNSMTITNIMRINTMTASMDDRGIVKYDIDMDYQLSLMLTIKLSLEAMVIIGGVDSVRVKSFDVVC